MKITPLSISEIIDTSLLDYSMYVLQNRAIPSAIDGFKAGGRKLVYSMLNEYPTRKVKVAELSGAIAKHGFHHGESSAEGATVTLTSDWNNNCPIFTGHGNFGSRLIQEAAAARYIYVSLSPEFKSYFIDGEVTVKSLDEESPEPIHYLPVIPWVLVNGISGIAVGFACNILPRSIEDIMVATKSCLKNRSKFLEKNEPIPPTFPQFRGTISQESETGLNWASLGMVEYIGKYQYKILELPIGYDREAYVTLLNKLVDTDLIKDYEDSCSEDGFGFIIKVTGAQKEIIDKDPIAYFKLQKKHSENLTTLGHDGKLKIFKSVPELVAYFVDYRLTKFKDKIEYDKEKIRNEIIVLSDKQRFISHVIDGDIDFKTTTKKELLDFIDSRITHEDHGKSFIRIPLYDITQDAWTELESDIKKLMGQMVLLDDSTPEKLFQSKLNSIKI